MNPIDALRQCRDAIHDIALDLAIEQQNHLTNTFGNFRPHKHQAAADETAKLRAALTAADTALAALSEPRERVAFEDWMFASPNHLWQNNTASIGETAWRAWLGRASLAPAQQTADVPETDFGDMPPLPDPHPRFGFSIGDMRAYARAYGDARAAQAQARVPLSDEPLRAAVAAYIQAADAAWVELCEKAERCGVSSMPILPGQAASLDKFNELRRVFGITALAQQEGGR